MSMRRYTSIVGDHTLTKDSKSDSLVGYFGDTETSLLQSADYGVRWIKLETNLNVRTQGIEILASCSCFLANSLF